MKTERQDTWVKGASTAAQVPDAKMGAKLEHCRVEADGSVMARGGYIRCMSSNLSDTAASYGVRMFRDAGGTRRFVALAGTAAYKSATTAAGPWTSLATGLTAAYADFTEFKQGASNYLLWANGTDFKAYDGTSVSSPSGAPSFVQFVREFNDRVWCAPTSNLLYGSKVRDFNTWSVPSGILLQVGGSRPITGLEVAGPHLLVFKAEETARVTGFGEQSLVIAQGSDGVSQSVGCTNFRTIQPCGDAGVAWLSQRGIEFYNPANGYAQCVSRAIDAFFHPLPTSLTTLPYAADRSCFAFAPYATAHSYYDRRRGEYHLFILDTLGAQAEVVYVPATGACYLWPTIGASPDVAAATAWVYTAPPVAGDADFYALSINNRPHLSESYPVLREYGTTDLQGSDGADGVAFTGAVRTRNFQYGVPNRNKWGRILRATLRNVTAGQLTATLRAGSEIAAGNSHTVTLPVQRSKTFTTHVSVRGADLYGEVDLAPGIALDGMELDAEVLIRGDGR